jgi:hypothetical protein
MRSSPPASSPRPALVLHHRIDSGLHQKRLKTRWIALLRSGGIVADAFGDAVAEAT